jgi:hypothetical protein
MRDIGTFRERKIGPFWVFLLTNHRGWGANFQVVAGMRVFAVIKSVGDRLPRFHTWRIDDEGEAWLDAPEDFDGPVHYDGDWEGHGPCGCGKCPKRSLLARFENSPVAIALSALAIVLAVLFVMAATRDNAVLSKQATMEEQRACVRARFETTDSYLVAVTSCARVFGVPVIEIERNLP